MALDKRKSLKEQEKRQGPRLVRTANDDPVSPFNSYFRKFILEDEDEETIKKVEERWENRSERAKRVDRRYNAPIPEKIEKWIRNPDRYDLPGIDTVPDRIKQARVEEKIQFLKDKGIIDEVMEDVSLSGAVGEYSPKYQGTGRYEVGKKQIALDTDKPRTYAHETGHAIDFEIQERRKESSGKRLKEIEKFRDRVIGKQIKRTDLGTGKVLDRSKVRQEEREAFKISRRQRGSIDNAYRRKSSELIADALASKIIEPRAFKREAPKLNKKIEEIGSEVFQGDIF